MKEMLHNFGRNLSILSLIYYL